MRRFTIILAGILCASAGAASAGPRMEGPIAAPAPLVEIHHKPGHKGGPPWMRKNQSRDAWRAETQTRRTYTERRSDCRTTTRTEYDSYTDEYIRRTVRVCD
ncbi:hypothetical protein [Microvirga splendida]|uniref:Lectin-like protein BA14k n=1 Tax=Microvirga splendida TaxID=2795727 RepID=A0ABS0Y6D6_9HYPH|nr:hypothetical protein [Microvirga splendida]MBJ6127869.1 hypothetical protein [Microvirga splendida]